MKKNPVDEYLKKRKNSNRHRNKLLAVILTLSMAVFLTVNMGLRLTGITLTGDGSTAAVESSNDTAESTAETAAEEVTPETAENTAAPENMTGGGTSTADPNATETPAAEDTQQFTLTSAEADGFTVTVSGDPSVLPFPADEMSVSVKAQDVSDLNETQKNLYDTLLASQAEQADQIYEASADEGSTQTEEVDDTTLDAAKQSSEDQSVVTSDGTAVENNNSDTKSSTVTNYLFDVTLKHGDKAVEPTGEVQVSIQSDLFKSTDSDLSIIHLDEVKNEAVDTEAVINTDEGTAVLTMDSFSTIVVTDGTVSNGLIKATDLADAMSQAQNGDTIQLEKDWSGNNSFTISNNLSIDLNGHNITYTGKGNFFTVTNGTLTITDSKSKFYDVYAKPNGDDNVTQPSDNDVINDKDSTLGYSIEDNEYKLVYNEYQIRKNDADVPTTETIIKHTYTTPGYIKGTGGGNLIWVQGGGLIVNSGLLTRTNTSTVASIVYQTGGTVTMNGGYICGSTNTAVGAGIDSTDGELNINGGVIAENTSTNKGGAIYTNNITVNLTGGLITNNTVNCAASNGNGLNGGGGIAVIGGKLNMSGGSVTGNVSNDAGGGLYLGEYATNKQSTEFKMTGGTIASNVASTGEGGGIRLSALSTGTIDASERTIFITNNSTNTKVDWGGGGIFIQGDGNNYQYGGKLYIYNVLIADNSADAYGGGVAACPSGGTAFEMSNAALYNNHATGNRDYLKNHNQHNGKLDDNEDTTFVTSNNYNGYANDFYAVSNNDHSGGKTIATITAGMIGGGSPLWTGRLIKTSDTTNKTLTYDGNNDNYVDNDQDLINGSLEVKYVVGLTSATASNDDNRTRAFSKAEVFISQNSSGVHGGGIMANGTLFIGGHENNVKYAALNINGLKQLLSASTPQNISANDFKFLLLKHEPKYIENAWYYDDSKLQAVSTNDGIGYVASANVQSGGNFEISNVSIKDIISDTNVNNGSFYLIESIGNDDITYDSTIYKITVNYSSSSGKTVINNVTTTNTTYKIKNIFLSKKTSSETDYSPLDNSLYTCKSDGSNSINWDISLTNNSGAATFTNNVKPINLIVRKYSGTSNEAPNTVLGGAVFMLYKDEECKTVAKDNNGNDYSEQKTPSDGDNKGHITFGNLPYGTYYLKETKAPDGYKGLSNPIKITVDKNGVSFTDTSIYHSGESVGTYTVSYTKDSSGNRTAELDIPNSTGTVLPSTGGIGTDWFILGGCGLISIALIYALLMHSRREGGDLG